jgi:hypothetical protein
MPMHILDTHTFMHHDALAFAHTDSESDIKAIDAPVPGYLYANAHKCSPIGCLAHVRKAYGQWFGVRRRRHEPPR